MSTHTEPIRISRNFIRGAVIRTPRELLNLAGAGKSVYHSGWHRLSPATFIINWPFKDAMRLIQSGQLYNVISRPVKPKKCPWPVTIYNDKTGMYERKK